MTTDNQATTLAAEAESVEYTVDGRTFKAPKGKNLLEALLDAGEDVSYFCYHPGMSVAAACRQCLVATGPPPARLVPSCQMMVSDGLSIVSNSDQVLEARRQMLEYTLLNHPVDCVICDKAGECTLQKHYMDWDGVASLVDHPKVRKSKRVDLGPTVVLDGERCILCARCTRFCEEVALDPQLVFMQRGDHMELAVAPGTQLDNPYSLNVVDICPVGALTDKDFRFQIRVWELYATESVCQGCSAGCSLEVHHKAGKVYRLVPPKVHGDMNANWMCDYGRTTYKGLTEARSTEARVDGESTSLDAALARAAQDLSAIEPSRVGVVIGADLSNEDAFVAAAFAYDHLDGASVYLSDLPDTDNGDDILRRNDPNPNRAGTKACARAGAKTATQLATDVAAGSLDALYVLGDAARLDAETLASAQNLRLLLAQTTHQSPLVSSARVVLPAAAWAEVDGTVTNEGGEVKRLRSAIEPPGLARPHWDMTVKLARKMGLEMSFDSAEQIFAAMTGSVERFTDAQRGADKPTIQLRFAASRG